MKKTKKDGKGGKAPPKAGDRSDSVKENKKTPSSTRKSIQDISKTPDLAVPPENERSELQSSKDVRTVSIVTDQGIPCLYQA